MSPVRNKANATDTPAQNQSHVMGISNGMSKKKQLDDIKQSILDDNLTPKLRDGATQLVFGHGNPDSEIMFIGEAPGKNEDFQGKPFVGAAGKFLEEMLKGIGMKRSDVYISNIVKYRPPNNRDPQPDEKKEFWPYLIKEIAVIQPKIIVTLGRHSMEYFLPNHKISQIHGQPKRIRLRAPKVVGSQHEDGVQGAAEKRTKPYKKYGEGASQAGTQQSTSKLDKVFGLAEKQDELVLVVLPLFHPAAALYNGAMKQTLIEDFSNIPEIIKIINSKEKEKQPS